MSTAPTNEYLLTMMSQIEKDYSGVHPSALIQRKNGNCCVTYWTVEYVVYDQLQGHLTIFLMYCLASLFLKKWTLHSFGINTSMYKHVRQIVQNLGYQFLISKTLICLLPESIQMVPTVFSHVVRQDTLRLRQYDYL